MKIWEKIKQQKPLKIILGIGIGALLGFAYYYFIGCTSGTCPITSNPLSSILYGSVFGLILTFK